MSLINDALRRASAQRKPTQHDLLQMEPIQRVKSHSGGPGLTVILICFVLAGAAMLGGWAYWNKKYKKPAAAEAAANAKANSNTPAPALSTNSSVGRAANTLTKVQAQNREGEKAADTIQAAPAAKPAAPPPAATEKLPKLQGIFFSGQNSTALLDGKTVHVGDEVAGVKVVEIKRTSVLIQTAAGARELTMK